MKVTIPADYESAIDQMGTLAALLDKNGWKAGAFIATCVKPGGQTGGRPRKVQDGASFQRVGAAKFSKDLNAKGWSRPVIERHYEAWERAAEDGVVPHAADLTPGEKVDVPDTGWAEYYPPRWSGDIEAEAVAAQAKEDGAGASKAVDIAQNTKALAAAIKASPKAARAAAAALVDTEAAEDIAQQVMADPVKAERALAKPKVQEGIQAGRVRRLQKERTAHTPTPKGGEPVVAKTQASWTLMLAMDDIQNRLAQIAQMLNEGKLTTDEKDTLREFIEKELVLWAEGILDHPALTGEDLSPEMFS